MSLLNNLGIKKAATPKPVVTYTEDEAKADALRVLKFYGVPTGTRGAPPTEANAKLAIERLKSNRPEDWAEIEATIAGETQDNDETASQSHGMAYQPVSNRFTGMSAMLNHIDALSDTESLLALARSIVVELQPLKSRAASTATTGAVLSKWLEAEGEDHAAEVLMSAVREYEKRNIASQEEYQAKQAGSSTSPVGF